MTGTGTTTKQATRGVFGAILRTTEIGTPVILLIQRAGYPDADSTATPAKQGYPGQWELPGGRVEEEGLPGKHGGVARETDEDCLIRRVREETGLEIKPLGSVSSILTAPPGVVSEKSDDAFVYLCEVTGGELKNFPTSSHLYARWVSMTDIDVVGGDIKVLTNPTSTGDASRMMKMIRAGFLAHQASQS